MQNSFKPSFTYFVFFEKRNSLFLWSAALGAIIQFAVFKFLYPYPDFFLDSYSYIYAASLQLDINIWPIGYSKFLSFFHWFTYSDTALVAFQYFFLITAALYYFFTVLYFLRPGKSFTYIAYFFLFFNPLFLYLGNFVNSDALFIPLSLLWMTELIWILNRPRHYQILVQAILLFLAFSVRNNAYYYPVIATFAFFISRRQLWAKIAGSLSGLVLISLFIIHSRSEAYKLTGIHQFSFFTGWQLANNALYMYDKVKVDTTLLPTEDMRDLDRYSRQFYLQTSTGFRDSLSFYVGNYFICQPESPLFNYLLAKTKQSPYEVTHTYPGIIAWGKASSEFSEYGIYLIRHHPIEFARYFILLNTKYYFLPPLEKFKAYNQGSDHVKPIVQNWFKYKVPYVRSVSKNLQGQLLFIFPILFFLINLCFLPAIAWFFIRKSNIKSTFSFNSMISLSLTFFLSNFFFSILSTMNVFRYQVFPMIVFFTDLLLVLELIDAEETNRPTRDFNKPGNRSKWFWQKA